MKEKKRRMKATMFEWKPKCEWMEWNNNKTFLDFMSALVLIECSFSYTPPHTQRVEEKYGEINWKNLFKVYKPQNIQNHMNSLYTYFGPKTHRQTGRDEQTISNWIKLWLNKIYGTNTMRTQ